MLMLPVDITKNSLNQIQPMSVYYSFRWAMTPLMYVGAYFFKVPSSAIVGLSCGNIFLGFIPTIATFILEIMAIEEDVSHH